MSTRSVTILGGGNTAFAVAANLTLAGHAVTLCEIPSFDYTIEPILVSHEITQLAVAQILDVVDALVVARHVAP